MTARRRLPTITATRALSAAVSPAWLNIHFEGNRVAGAYAGGSGDAGDREVRRDRPGEDADSTSGQEVRRDLPDIFDLAVGDHDERPIRRGGGQQRGPESRATPCRSRVRTGPLVAELPDLTPPCGGISSRAPVTAPGTHTERRIEKHERPERPRRHRAAHVDEKQSQRRPGRAAADQRNPAAPAEPLDPHIGECGESEGRENYEDDEHAAACRASETVRRPSYNARPTMTP